MSRYIGVKNNDIYVVSDNIFLNKEFDIIKAPPYLNDVSSEDIITDFKFNNNVFELKNTKISNKKLKIAFVSNYWMHCGISTYAENLYPEIIKRIGDYKLFVEDSINDTRRAGQVKGKEIPSDKVVVCWKRGYSLKDLANQIKEYNPDIILINHEWGIFPNARYFLSFLTQISKYRTIITMHSIFPNHSDKIVVEAALPEIVVHLEGAKNCLIDKKNIGAKIHTIPHGCYENNNNSKLWNIYKSNNTFIQIGFGLRYKCFEDSIKAVALLKDKYKDIFFTAIFSESPFLKIEHQIYYQELIDLTKKLDVEDNVAIIRGFQSDNCLDAYFRTNRASVFPYKSSGEHFVYGSSGACRLAMSKNIPVITSNIPHFSDLNTIKADTPEQIAAELDKLFSDPKFAAAQIKRQNDFISINSWENIAEKYISIFLICVQHNEYFRISS